MLSTVRPMFLILAVVALTPGATAGRPRPTVGRVPATRRMRPLVEYPGCATTLVTGGTLDTKGGPKTNPEGQVLNIADKPIPGLYGVGNCVASPTGRAYWAGGGTLGPIFTFAYLTAEAIHADAAG